MGCVRVWPPIREMGCVCVSCQDGVVVLAVTFLWHRQAGWEIPAADTCGGTFSRREHLSYALPVKRTKFCHLPATCLPLARHWDA